MIVTDIINPAELTGFVRELAFADFTLDRWFPVRERRTIEYAFKRSDRRRVDMAEYRAFDVESPVGDRRGFERIRGELPPLSKKIPLGEEQRLQLEQLRANGAVQRGSADEINAIFDDAFDLAESVASRLEFARGTLLETGRVSFTNDRGFVSAVAGEGLLGAHVVTAGVLWSTTATANPLGDLRGWVQTYQANNGGRKPAVALISTAILGDLLLNTAIRNLTGVGATVPAILTLEQLQAVFNAHGLPRFEVYDAQVAVAGTATRVTPENKVILLPSAGGDRFGETTMGVTAEALELAQQNQLQATAVPGVVACNLKTFDPVQTWTKVAGLGLPVLKDPNAIMVATVR